MQDFIIGFNMINKDKFNLKVLKVSCGCWLWMGHSRKGTYGDLKIDGKYKQAHRVSLELYKNKTIPTGNIVCHKCNIPSCVNPDHLYIGTHKDNAFDRRAAGTHLEGVNHPMYGLRGKDSPNYGKKRTKATRLELSKGKIGKKNPMYGIKGNNFHNTKVTDEEVFLIRKEFETTSITQSALAIKYNTSISTIHNLVRYKTRV